MSQIIIKMILGWIIVHERNIISHFRSIISSMWGIWHHFDHVEVGRSSASAQNFLINPMSFFFHSGSPLSEGHASCDLGLGKISLISALELVFDSHYASSISDLALNVLLCIVYSFTNHLRVNRFAVIEPSILLFNEWQWLLFLAWQNNDIMGADSRVVFPSWYT